VHPSVEKKQLGALNLSPHPCVKIFSMKRRDFLQKWGLSGLKINLGFLEGEFAPQHPDRAAAWELYVELLTRVTTQYLAPEDGDEKTALDSVHAIFPLTREILRRQGSGCGEFAKLAIPVLNRSSGRSRRNGTGFPWPARLTILSDAASSTPSYPPFSPYSATIPAPSRRWQTLKI
jgi:hypothetical protein